MCDLKNCRENFEKECIETAKHTSLNDGERIIVNDLREKLNRGERLETKEHNFLEIVAGRYVKVAK